MAAVNSVKEWGFSNASIYTLGGDGVIAASALSMTDPVLQLPWATHWDVEPGYDGNGDAVLAQNVTYTAETGGANITMLDGELHMQTAITAAPGSPGWFTTIRGGATNPILARLATGGLILETSGPDAEYEKYQDGAFREWVLKAVDTVASLDVVALHKHEMSGLTDSSAAGTVTLRQSDAGNPITLGGGAGGTEDQPYLAYRRTGTCELKAANQWTIPLGVTTLGRLAIIADRYGSGTTLMAVKLQYKIDAGAWTDCPADGDLSGETFTAGSSTFLWRINDGSGIGMDNSGDCRYVPTVHAVSLTYQRGTAIAMRRTEPLVRRRD